MNGIKKSLIVSALILFLMGNASALEIMSDQKSIIINPDGSFTDVSPLSASASLEAGGELLEGTYVLVRMDDGTFEYLPTTIAYSLEGDYGVSYKGYSSSSECNSKCSETYANSFCKTYFGSNYIMKAGSGPTCDGSICEWRCVSSGTTCTSDSQCTKSMSCEYCQIGTHECDGGRCIYATCGTRTECGYEQECDPNSADGGLEEAKAVCIERIERNYGGSKYVEGARCSSDGTAICKTDRACTVECNRADDPICESKAERACTYGYTSASCNLERDCNGEVTCATCKYNCKSAPVTQVCGDGNCDGFETSSNCPADCGEEPEPVDDNNCGDGICGSGENPENCNQDCRYARCYSVGGTVYPVVTVDSGGELVSDLSTRTPCASGECSNGVCVPLEQSSCGDGVCEGETIRTCPQDCDNPQTAECGNGFCEAGETEQSCEPDCANECQAGTASELYCEGRNLVQDYQSGSCVQYTDVVITCENACVDGVCVAEQQEGGECGDGVCDSTENRLNCGEDCVKVMCGDGVCDEEESEASCSADCEKKGIIGGGKNAQEIDYTLLAIGGIVAAGFVVTLIILGKRR